MLVRGVPKTRKELEALKRLTEEEVPPMRRLRAMRQELAYLVGDASELGFR